MKRWIVAFAIVMAAGCAGARTVPEPAPTRSAAPATSPVPATTAPPNEAIGSSLDDPVLLAVDGFDRSTIAVNDPPDPDHPDLARYRTGEVLRSGIASVASNRNLGIAYRMAPAATFRHEARVVQLSDVRALVHDCIVDEARQVAMGDGTVLNDAVATKLYATRLMLVDGTWKVFENDLLERRDGVVSCASLLAS